MWFFGPKVLIDVPAERYHIKIEQFKTTLIVYNLTKEDSGSYHCGAVYPLKTSLGNLTLKVLTFMEPLKILFGIVAEVIILVAAIFLCEKWQSKKKPCEGIWKTKNMTLHIFTVICVGIITLSGISLQKME